MCAVLPLCMFRYERVHIPNSNLFKISYFAVNCRKKKKRLLGHILLQFSAIVSYIPWRPWLSQSSFLEVKKKKKIMMKRSHVYRFRKRVWRVVQWDREKVRKVFHVSSKPLALWALPPCCLLSSLLRSRQLSLKRCLPFNSQSHTWWDKKNIFLPLRWPLLCA